MDNQQLRAAPEKVKKFAAILTERGDSLAEQSIWAKDLFERFDIQSFDELVAFKQELRKANIDFNRVVTPLTMSQLIKINMNSLIGIHRMQRAGFKLELFRGDLSKLKREKNSRLSALADTTNLLN